ncbi:MAG: DUF2726 domain-containing protein [Akkermansiaceae bacterium]|nr:DUF2726 domain-containing protein [Akkermansiaceae bacterium]
MPQILEQLLPLIGILIVVAIAFGVLKALLTGKTTRVANLPYESIPCLFTPAERSFLGVLDQVIESEYRVFGKVRAADVMSVTKGMNRSEWQKAFNRIQSKHFDFVICRASDSSIVLLVELDDKSHKKSHRRERDDFVEKATEAAGIPLLRIPCQRTYSAHNLSTLIATRLSESNNANNDSVQATAEAVPAGGC